MADEKKLKRKKASCKGRLTLFKNYLKLLSSPLNSVQHEELQLRVTKVQLLYDEFDTLQKGCECLVDDITELLVERDDFETSYFRAVSIAEDLLSPKVEVGKGLGTTRSSSSGHKLVKLPPIPIPSFSGSYEQWLEFHDTFVSLVHNNEEIDDILKFHHLKAALRDSAALVIQSLELSAANYPIAWNLLCQRYSNKKLLIQNHVANLFNIESLQRESAPALKRLTDQINKNLRSLESLGEPTSHWDTLLIYIFTQKLDARTYHEWEEYKSQLDDTISINLNMFITFLRNRADLLATLELSKHSNSGSSQKVINPNPNNNKLKTFVSINHTSQSQSISHQPQSTKLKPTIVSCPKCSGDHYLYNCSQFLSLNNEQRLEEIPNFKLCYNCFHQGHFANNCKRNGCRLCKRKHHVLIHVSKPQPFNKSDTLGTHQNADSGSSSNVTLAACMTASTNSLNVNNGEVLLSTALIRIFDNDKHEHVARVLLDSGSTSCLMTEKLCNSLGLPVRQIDKSIIGINNSVSSVGKVTSVFIQSLSENYSTKMTCFVLPTITDRIPNRPIKLLNLNLPKDLCLADPNFHTPSDIDILIGADLFWDILGSRKIKLGDNQPILFETRLGWIISGSLNDKNLNSSNFSIHCNLTKLFSTDSNVNLHDDLQSDLTRFWKLEEVSPKSSFSIEEKLCEEHFKKNTVRLENGRFCVRLPLKQSEFTLGNSFNRAKRCFLSLENRIHKQPSYKSMYTDFMTEYISLGHMTELKVNNLNKSLEYYIPHHGVLRESSSTTKLRVVFNASSPTTSGISLNQIQMVGPVIQDDLLSILLRFRQHTYVISSDIQMMYRQIIVHPEDRHLQQIVWRGDVREPLKVYQLNTVTYGTASAPFLAIRCLYQLGLDCKDPTVSNIILHDFFVDDMLTGADTLDEVLKIRDGVNKTLGSAGMILRKWKSNNQSLLQDESLLSSLHLDIGNSVNKCSKTLGVDWLTESDELCYFINDKAQESSLTKRSILSIISSVFDPLGLLAPVIISMKILLQKLWLHKLSWDEPLSPDIKQVWSTILKDLPSINDLRIPRRVIGESHLFLEFHIFVDASQSAYGSCMYVRSVNACGIATVRLLFAKSRVAPIKPLTIPRLELLGALVGVRLYQKALTSLRMQVTRTIFWTDSTVLLGWLGMHPNRLQPFVRNRTAEIIEKTPDCVWRHVPTENNPADYLSRGVDIKCIRELHMWWSGPKFLTQDKSMWPCMPGLDNVQLPETRDQITLNVTACWDKRFINFERFSQFYRLQRSVAYAQRFILSCKKQRSFAPILTVEELQNALDTIIRQCQTDSFPEYSMILAGKQINFKSPLIGLNIFLDKNKIMRVGGRLSNSTFEFNKKHPTIIQSTHIFTKLLFKFKHKQLLHAGPQLLLASIREEYWPIGGRNLAKKIYHDCVRCSRFKVRTVSPLMGNLPPPRVAVGSYPFENVGIDYAGPISSASRQGRGCKIVKVYIAIFVCFATKAIHLELVGDLTSQSFLSTLRRFIARRGKPVNIYSDNGTSFVGAYNDLSKFLKTSSVSLSDTLALEGIAFHFIPAYSPHFGGLWEAGVRSTKFHLVRVLGLSNLTFEELYTVLVQIEAVLNSRPLTPISSEPNDLTPLTPGHFIVGRPLTALPTPSLEDQPTQRLTRYQRIEQIRQHFWSRWSKEYVSELQQRTKWRQNINPLRPNTLVLIKEDGLPPLKWKLGRVIKVYPGADKINRVADIRVTQGTIRRAFSKICPLPVEADC